MCCPPTELNEQKWHIFQKGTLQCFYNDNRSIKQGYEGKKQDTLRRNIFSQTHPSNVGLLSRAADKLPISGDQLNITLIFFKCQFYLSNKHQENVTKMNGNEDVVIKDRNQEVCILNNVNWIKYGLNENNSEWLFNYWVKTIWPNQWSLRRHYIHCFHILHVYHYPHRLLCSEFKSIRQKNRLPNRHLLKRHFTELRKTLESLVPNSNRGWLYS